MSIENDPLIRVVHTAHAFLSAPVGKTLQAVIYPRPHLVGDFAGLATHIFANHPRHIQLPLTNLPLILPPTQAVKQAYDQVAADVAAYNIGASPMMPRLRLAPASNFTGDDHSPVTHFHEDRLLGTSRVLCAYSGGGTEWLHTRDAQCINPTRRLYAPKPGAQIQCLPHGALVRFIGDGHDVPPFIHRTPHLGPKDGIRMLMVGHIPLPREVT